MNTARVRTELGQSAIQHATRQNRWLFLGYMISLVAGALFTYLLWKSSNDVQDAITAEAKVEISKAQGDAAQANKRSKELEESNLKLRERVATVESTAADLQKLASDSQAAQQRVALELERQKERTAEAEKALFRLRSQVQDRSLSTEQVQKFLEETRNVPKGRVTVNIVVSNPETIAYGKALVDLISRAGWMVKTANILVYGGPLGLSARIDSIQPIRSSAVGDRTRNEFPANSPVLHGAYLLEALNDAGVEVTSTVSSGSGVQADQVEIIVNTKAKSIPN